MFAWDTKRVKTTKVDEQTGRPIIVEVSPKEIILGPNRHRIESILSALCVGVGELITIQEQQAARIRSMLAPKEEADGGSKDGDPQKVPGEESSGVQL